MKRIELYLICAAGALILAGLVLIIVNTTYSPIAQVLLILALILVTSMYAIRAQDIAQAAKSQADASLKMADEMAHQRYDTVRPILDIVMTPLNNMSLSREIYMPTNQLTLPNNLLCRFRNIGIGPAIDVYYFTFTENEKTIKKELGVLRINEESEEVSIFVEQKEADKYIVVYYRDIYGRIFNSTRKALLTEEKILKLGPLNSNRIEEDKNP